MAVYSSTALTVKSRNLAAVRCSCTGQYTMQQKRTMGAARKGHSVSTLER